jgi:hypothetical protein
MDIQQVIQTINQMQADGIIDVRAIGGAVGAMMHLEPVSPSDVEIFLPFRAEPGLPGIGSRPIRETSRGFRCPEFPRTGEKCSKEDSNLHGLPHQILRQFNRLVFNGLRRKSQANSGNLSQVPASCLSVIVKNPTIWDRF